ncbi:hypothetical protein, partial [Escherichia coli]|uniref:hypothetical protein n=1 Tax=Escherichia coli TaxID=562 RepID=UPI002576D405
ILEKEIGSQTTSVKGSKKKRGHKRKKSVKEGKTQKREPVNLGTPNEPIYIKDLDEDSDSVDTQGDSERTTETQTKPKKTNKEKEELIKKPNKERLGSYPDPEKELKQRHEIIEMVTHMQEELETRPQHVIISDMVHPNNLRPLTTQKPLDIPSVILEANENSQNASMDSDLFRRIFEYEDPEPIQEVEIPVSPTPSYGKEVTGTPLNIPKLLDFMASKTDTTITTRLCGDIELFAALKALVNGELNIGGL